jgi:hypothetical protein
LTDFDYTSVTSALIQSVSDATGYQLIEGNSSGDQPEYPFCTFTFTSPMIEIERNYDGRLFEIVLSLTWHDTSSIGVLNLSKKLETYLKSTLGRQTLEDNGIVLVDTSNSNARDNLISIDYERTAGFDIQLRVRDSFVDNADFIESIQINTGGNE